MPEEPIPSETEIREWIRARGLAAKDVERLVFERQSRYTFQSRMAPSLRRGNVFLVGDAAHLQPPFR